MRPKNNSNRFEMSFRLHGDLHEDFTAATFETKTLLHMGKWYLLINANLINAKKCYQW